jgi:ubiquinone/menaquinone biosynthesis C-methylase UbiE
VFLADTNITRNLLDILSSGAPVIQARREKKTPDLGISMYQYIRKETRDPVTTDKIIYKELRELIYGKEENVVNEKKVGLYNVSNINKEKLEQRGRKRAKDIKILLPKEYVPKTFLDIGCGDGSITSAIASMYNISKKKAFGIDQREIKDITDLGFTFHASLDETSDLSFLKDNSIELVTAIMSLHHIKDIKGMMKEIKRVVKPGGYVIIREHDVNSPDFKIILNIMHGLYALVWSNPMEDPDFLETYYASYKSEKEWRALFTSFGFQWLKNNDESPDKNHCRYYYSVFQKKH